MRVVVLLAARIPVARAMAPIGHQHHTLFLVPGVSIRVRPHGR
jgi:hypothetical protein